VIDYTPFNVVLLDDQQNGGPLRGPTVRKLMHGTIDHGLQFLAPTRRGEPTAYYGPRSGIGLAIEDAKSRGKKRFGVVGLGVGTLAAYGKSGEVFKFYEINPLVQEIAQKDFTFLRDSAATIEVVLGDARLSLEREPAQKFDVLAVDAFSGDAIPVHLLTEEAMRVYLWHLRPDGVLALHISNIYLDLEPVVQRAAEKLGVRAVVIFSEGDRRSGQSNARWALLSRRAEFFEKLAASGTLRPPREDPAVRLWTDQYSNLVRILK
jgi:hypothetical protein